MANQNPLTADILELLPPLYSKANVPHQEKIAQVKFIRTPENKIWYGVEYNPDTRTFWGYIVDSARGDFGFFILDDILRGQCGRGPKAKLDETFRPTRIGDIIIDLKNAKPNSLNT